MREGSVRSVLRTLSGGTGDILQKALFASPNYGTLRFVYASMSKMLSGRPDQVFRLETFEVMFPLLDLIANGDSTGQILNSDVCPL